MAGTDRSRQLPVAAAPAVILVAPQLGENIGSAVRAMLNFGLTDLRLVAPRDGWPNEAARANASGADTVIDDARVYGDVESALADLTFVVAATARPRDMRALVLTPATAATRLRTAAAAGERCGMMLGRESTGLDNDSVVLADAVVTVPTNPGFASLNLAMTVLLLAHQWFVAADDTPAEDLSDRASRAASKTELQGLFEHLESELDACGFLRVAEKRPSMVRNLRNIFQRARLSEQEVRTLRGVIAGLVERGRRHHD